MPTPTFRGTISGTINPAPITFAGLRNPGSRRIVVLGGVCLAAALATSVLGACNTTKGIGKDIESLGEGISNTASDAGAKD